MSSGDPAFRILRDIPTLDSHGSLYEDCVRRSTFGRSIDPGFGTWRAHTVLHNIYYPRRRCTIDSCIYVLRMLLRVAHTGEVSKKRRDVQCDRPTLLGGDAVLLQPDVHLHAVGLEDHAVVRQAACRGQCGE